jgi:para-nitrobenzyl esterase
MGFTLAKLMAASAAGALLATTTLATAGPMIAIPGDPVATQSGKVAGTKLASGVKAYLGVPFAKPPTGQLRWKPPQPMSWDGVWNADRKGPECIQVLRPHDINHYFGEEASGEDCLTLNIWTPAEAKAGEHRPVIVFIYGGGGTIGSSGMANYDGENAARRGAIFVNLNYRVGLMGYMAHPELTKEQGGHSGNYGYLDQNAALKWVRDNIAAFGGDPGKVVISGQSAGAGGVAAQMTSPLSKGLFRGAVMMSACNLGGSGIIAGGTPLADGEKVGLEVQKRLGARDLAAMRNIPADRILAQQAESQVGANVQGVRAPAVIDGYFWTASKTEAFASGAASDVPIIASSNGDDIDAGNSPFTKTHTVAEYEAAARTAYGPDADAFLKAFPVKTDADVQPMAHAAAMENGMLASSRACGETLAKYGKSGAYIDTFTHRHPYAPGLVLPDQDVATVGAYHTADVPYWFDTLDKYNLFRATRVPTAWDKQLTDQMLGALVALAETGSPSTKAMPWPAWTTASPQYLVLGDAVTTRKMDLKRMDWLAAHPLSRAAQAPPRTGPRD